MKTLSFAVTIAFAASLLVGCSRSIEGEIYFTDERLAAQKLSSVDVYAVPEAKYERFRNAELKTIEDRMASRSEKIAEATEALRLLQGRSEILTRELDQAIQKIRPLAFETQQLMASISRVANDPSVSQVAKEAWVTPRKKKLNELEEAIGPLDSVKSQVEHEIKKVTDQIKNLEESLRELRRMQEADWYGRYLEASKLAGVVSSTSDSEGRFRLSVGRSNYYILALGERKAEGRSDRMIWFVEPQRSPVVLTERNRIQE